MTILDEADNWLTRCLGPRGNSETDPWSWTRCFVAGEKEARGAWLFGHHKRPGSPRIKWVGLPDGMALLDFKFAVVRGLNQLLCEDKLRGFGFELSLKEKDVQLWCDSGAATLRGVAEESVSAFIDRVCTQVEHKGFSEDRELLDNKKLPLPDPYAGVRPNELGLGIVATIRENHVKILRREMDRKLVVMSGLDDTWSGEKL